MCKSEVFQVCLSIVKNLISQSFFSSKIIYIAFSESKINLFNTHWWILYYNIESLHCTEETSKTRFSIEVAPRIPDEDIVGTSFLFNFIIGRENGSIAKDKKYDLIKQFSELLSKRGITHAWFGRKECLGFTQTFKHWRYLKDGHDDNDFSTGSTPKSSSNHVVLSENGNEDNKTQSEAMQSISKHVILQQTNDFLQTLFDIPLYQ